MIPITYFRSSSFNTHDMCPMKFFMEYVLGFSGKSNKKADKGTIFHKVMEILAAIKLGKQNNKRIYNDDICGKIKIPKNLDDIDIINLIDCVYVHYTSNFAHHIWEDIDYKDCVKWVYKALDFNGGYFDPRNQLIVTPEKRFNIELTENWAKYDYEKYNLKGYLRLMGTIDLITDLGDSSYEIVDYKTGRNVNWGTDVVYTFKNIRENFQLRFYHLVCSILYPDIKIFTVTIYFLNDTGPLTMTLGPEDLAETLELIRIKFEEIRNTDFPSLNKTWKCKKFCDGGTTTFENTNVKPLTATTYHNFTSKGEVLKKCDQINYSLKYREIEKVIKNMSKDGHDMNFYKAPGSV